MEEQELHVRDEVEFYAKTCISELISILLLKDASQHYSIQIQFLNLSESSIIFAHYFFQNPRKALKTLDDAFKSVCFDLSKTHTLKSDMIFKENLHVRLTGLPDLPEVYKSVLPKCSEVGSFMCITGTVIRSSAVKILQYRKLWRCGKCKFQFNIDAEVDQGYVFEKPSHCLSPEYCNGKNFTLLSSDIDTAFCKDYQEIKIQEQVYCLGIGTVPRSMWVILEDDLVETCFPGNDVCISGILIQRWKPLISGYPINIDLVLLAHNVEVKNKMSCDAISKENAIEFGKYWLDGKTSFLAKRNFILSSICPQVFGLYIVKLAVALTLAGGVQKEDGNSKVRGDSHLLLVGDPGTAKSQFLKFASKISPRSVLTSGIGTTNAGLTVSAVKESGKWQLEAGALVLADGGICCIDEFSCMKEQDKTCIHEAMEQQTISVAKAGLVCSLNTRCSIIASTNPKGKYDAELSLSENTALASPLLSRFDIILVLLDTFDRNWDEMVSSFILNGRNLSSLVPENNVWSLTKMKSYFALIRYIKPKVTPQCERILQAYYKQQRSAAFRNAARTTPRLLQSLLRLAEGHARLMFRNEVLIIDAVVAIALMESSMLGFSVLEDLSPLHTTFPIDPVTEYEDRANKVLQLLSLQELLPEIRQFEKLYTDCNIKNLLMEISNVWNLKLETNQCSSFQKDESENHQNSFEGDKQQENISISSAVKQFKENNLEISHSTQSVENAQGTVQFIDVLEGSSSGKEPFYSKMQDNNEKHNVQQFDEISTLFDLNNVFNEKTVNTSKDLQKQPIDTEKNFNEILQVEVFDHNKTNRSLNKTNTVMDFTLEANSSVKMDLDDMHQNLPTISSSNENPVAKKPKLESHSTANRFKKFSFMQKKQTFNEDSDWFNDISNNQAEKVQETELQHNAETTQNSNAIHKLCLEKNLYNNDDITNASFEHHFSNCHSDADNSTNTKVSVYKTLSKEIPTTSKRNLSISVEKLQQNIKKFAFVKKPTIIKKDMENVFHKSSSNNFNGEVMQAGKAGTSTEQHHRMQNIASDQQKTTQSSQLTFKKLFGSSIPKFDISDFDLDGPIL